MVILITFLRWTAIVFIANWLIVYWDFGRKIIRDIRYSIRSKNAPLDTILMIGMSLNTLLLMISAVVITFRIVKITENGFLSLSGCLLVIAGIEGMFHCGTLLGGLWSADTSLRKEHQVVMDGPYGVVRHPIYSFAILMYAGLGILFPAWWNLLLAGMVILAYAVKSVVEDRFLEKNLTGYQEYRQRVKWRILPGIW